MKLRQLICIFLPIYFSSKMLWDNVPYVFKIFSYMCIIFAILFALYQIKLKYNTLIIQIAFFIYCSYIVFNGMINENIHRFTQGIYQYIFFVCVLFVGLVFYNNVNLTNIFKLLAYFLFAIALLSFVEFSQKSYILGGTMEAGHISWEGDFDLAFRTKVFTRSYLSHGVILGLGVLINYYIYKRLKQKFFFFSSLTCYFAIFTTQSRGPLVATTLATIFLLYNFNSFLRKKVFIIFIPIIILIGFIILSDFNTGNSLLDYYFHRVRSIFDWESERSNVDRAFLWLTALEMFSNNILLGIGICATGSWDPTWTHSLTVTESGVLQRLVELGILGFVIYYGFVILLIKNIAKRIKYLPKEKVKETLLCISCAILILVDDCTLQVTEEFMITFFLWFFMAIACRNTNIFEFKRSLA